MAGRGQKSGHKKQKRDGGELPRFAMDYGFLGDEGQPTASLLVMRELKTGMMLGIIVEKKGVGAPWVEQRIANFINGFGHKKLLVRSDNEPSILALRKKVAELVEGQVIPEDAIKGESQTNGLAEVGVKILEGMIRTLKLAVEERIKVLNCKKTKISKKQNMSFRKLPWGHFKDKEDRWVIQR